MAQSLFQVPSLWNDTEYEKLQGLRQTAILQCVSILEAFCHCFPSLSEFFYSLVFLLPPFFLQSLLHKQHDMYCFFSVGLLFYHIFRVLTFFTDTKSP